MSTILKIVKREMSDGKVEAWNTMTWFDGFLFTVWIAALYIGKLKIDQRFARRTVYRVKLEDKDGTK